MIDDYPEQARENGRSASALRTLANFTERLAADDPDFRHWRNAQPTRDGSAFLLHRQALDRLARFGLNRGAWQQGPPDEAQMRNILRRVSGLDAAERAGDEA